MTARALVEAVAAGWLTPEAASRAWAEPDADPVTAVVLEASGSLDVRSDEATEAVTVVGGRWEAVRDGGTVRLGQRPGGSGRDEVRLGPTITATVRLRFGDAAVTAGRAPMELVVQDATATMRVASGDAGAPLGPVRVIVTRGSAVVHLTGCGPLDVRASCRYGRIGFAGLQGLGDLAGTGQVRTIAPEVGARTVELQVEAGDVTVSWEKP